MSMHNESIVQKVPRLSIKHVTKSFGGTHALNDISFDLMPGEIHALVGENGAGKSTLIKTITGLIHQDSGSILLDGKEVLYVNPRDAKNHGVTAVYQDPNLFPHLTVAENMYIGRYPMRGGRIDFETIRKDSQAILDNLGFEINASTRVGDLSVAESEYVEIARALTTDLKLLILDEPTSALTTREANLLYKAVRDVRAKGTTVVWISHRMEEIRPLVDSVTIMRDGTHVKTCAIDDVTDDEIIALMVGHPVNADQTRKNHQIGKEALCLSHVSSEGLFDDISITVHHGEVVGLAGLVGAGRSELVQSIFGLRGKVTGQVVVEGEEIKHINTAEMVRRNVLYCPEDRDAEGIIMQMGVQDNISLPNLGFLSRAGIRSSKRERQIGMQQHDSLSIKAAMHDLVSSLSGGNRQKVALARWLARNPEVLILDEPTHGIDVGTKTEIHDLVSKLVEQGLAVLLISSDMPELLEMSDRIYVMARGRLTAEFVTSETTQEQIMVAAMSKGGESVG